MRAGDALHMRRFIFQYGQPPEIRAAQERAMGFKIEAKGYADH
jgi:hypothetical protein